MNSAEHAVPATSKRTSVPDAAIREMSFEDYPQIANLETRYGLEARPFEQWRELWTGNPAYRTDWPIGWVLETAAGQIVGSLANVPLRYELNGCGLLVATGRGWVVDEKYRSYSLALLTRFYASRLADMHLITSANANSAPVFRFFGSQRVPAGTWDQSAFWVTGYVGFASSSLRKKVGSSSALLRYPAAAALALRDSVTKNSRVHRREVEVSSCETFDERFDRFWQCLRQVRRGILLADRSREHLQWHFKSAIDEGLLWVATLSRGTELQAYAIFLRSDKQEYGLRRIRVVDFKSLQNETEDWATLLGWALKRCRREGIHMLERVGYLNADASPGIRPHTRRLSSWSHYYRTTNKDLAETLGRPETWEPSLFDGDATL